MARFLQHKGFTVLLYGFDESPDSASITMENDIDAAVSDADAVILPLPVSRDGETLNVIFEDKKTYLSDIVKTAKKGITYYAGMPDEEFKKALEAKGAVCRDYYALEEVNLKNALLSAEGIAGILIDRLPVTVSGLKVGITGYGRVGRMTARLLRNMGADVTVFARRADARALAETDFVHAKSFSYLESLASDFDVIINTVPTLVIDKITISKTKPTCILIETASPPYGIDFKAASYAQRELIKAFSLPGKTAPESAGKILGEAVFRMLTEESV